MKNLIKLVLCLFLLSACGPLIPLTPEAVLTPGTYEYQDFAYYMTFSPDDSLLAVTTLTGSYVYDTKTYKQLAAFKKARGATIIFGEQYMAAITSYELFVWDLKNYKLLFEKNTEEPILFQSLAISPDDKVLVTSEQDQMRIWSLPEGKLMGTIPGKSFMTDMAFKSNSRLIVADAYLGVIQEWDIRTQKKMREININIPVIRFNLSDDGQVAIVDYGNTGFELWNVDTGKIQHNYADIVSASGWQGLSGNNQYVVVWGYAFDGTNSGMSVWDLNSHVHIQEFTTPYVNGDGWRCGALNSGGSILAASNNEGYIYFYDLNSGEKINEIFLPYKFIIEKG